MDGARFDLNGGTVDGKGIIKILNTSVLSGSAFYAPSTEGIVAPKGMKTLFRSSTENHEKEGGVFFTPGEIASSLNTSPYYTQWSPDAKVYGISGVVASINVAHDGFITDVTLENSAGRAVSGDAYLIAGNNYIKLCDVMKVFDVAVGWDQPSKTATLDTSKSYEEPAEAAPSK